MQKITHRWTKPNRLAGIFFSFKSISELHPFFSWWNCKTKTPASSVSVWWALVAQRLLTQYTFPHPKAARNFVWCDLLCYMTPASQLWWSRTWLQARVSAEFTKSPRWERHEAGTAAASSLAQFESTDTNTDTFPCQLLAVWRWLCFLCCAAQPSFSRWQSWSHDIKHQPSTVQILCLLGRSKSVQYCTTSAPRLQTAQDLLFYFAEYVLPIKHVFKSC